MQLKRKWVVAPPLRFSGTNTSSWCCTQGLFVLYPQREGHLEGQLHLFHEESEDIGESVTGRKGRCWGWLLSQGILRQAHREWGELSVFPLPPCPGPHPSCLASTPPCSVTTIIIMTVVIKSVIIATNISWTLSMKLALC